MLAWARVALRSTAPLAAYRTAGAVRHFSPTQPVGMPAEGKSRPPKIIGKKLVKNPTPLAEAVRLVKNKAWAGFDETVDIAIRLNVDPRKPDQAVRGLAVLPKGTGKDVKVAVFATGAAAEEAKSAGAKIVGGDELVEQVKEGFLDFDRCLATPAMMKSMSKIARILGPRGLMPNPKLGTVTDNVGDVVKNLLSGITFKAEKAGIIHAAVGKASFSDQDLITNIEAVLDSLHNVRPKGVKEPYMKTAFISTTMSDSVRLDASELNRHGKVKTLVAGVPGIPLPKGKGTGWVDKANDIDWEKVDPSSVPSKKLRLYLQARRELKDKGATAEAA